MARLTYRDRAALPMLGTTMPTGPILLDTNVIINTLAGRGPPVLQMVIANLSRSFVSAVTVAELSWTRGRLDPDHPQTGRVVTAIEGVLDRIDPAKIIVPTAAQWRVAGTRAGMAVRGVAGEDRRFRDAADRHELLHDALTAAVASDGGFTVITEDRDFDLFLQIDPALSVLFYSRPERGASATQ